MELFIRLAEPQDSSRLIDLLTVLQAESDTFEVTHAVDDINPEVYADQLKQMETATDQVIFVVADEDGNLYGLTTAFLQAEQPTTAEVGVAVQADYQGYGLGQALLDELITWAETFSTLETLTLDVFTRNAVAHHIYAKAGFVDTGALIAAGTSDERQRMHRVVTG